MYTVQCTVHVILHKIIIWKFVHSGGDKIVAVLPDGSKRSFKDLKCGGGELMSESNTNFWLSYKLYYRTLEYFFHDDSQYKFREKYSCMSRLDQGNELLDVLAKVMANTVLLSGDHMQNVAEGIFLEDSYFKHSCSPNALRTTIRKELILRCTREEGVASLSEVTMTIYDDITMLPSERRTQLLKAYLVDCRCDKCTDAIHEAYGKACLKCPECGGGVPISETASVSCDHCKKDVSPERVADYCLLRELIDDSLNVFGAFLTFRMYWLPLTTLFFPTDRNYLKILLIYFDNSLVCTRKQVHNSCLRIFLILTVFFFFLFAVWRRNRSCCWKGDPARP